MNFEINVVSDDSIEVPITYSTIASHLPPPEETTNKNLRSLANVTRVATRIMPSHVCYTFERCLKPRCKGGMIVLRDTEDKIIWQCSSCLTKGQITGFKNTVHDFSGKKQLKGPISVEITKKEDQAANNIRGLPSDAHNMIILAHVAQDGSIYLSGDENAFSELAGTISEELEYDLAKKSDQRHLFSLMESAEQVLDLDVHIL
jgi:hypothetical protein